MPATAGNSSAAPSRRLRPRCNIWSTYPNRTSPRSNASSGIPRSNIAGNINQGVSGSIGPGGIHPPPRRKPLPATNARHPHRRRAANHFRTSSNGRVFSTSAAVSPALRALFTPAAT